MAKYVVFSFDDGRLDTYTNAYRILSTYSMPFTLNVCSDFVENEKNYTCFESAGNKSVSKEQLLEMQNKGVEIACHGHLHLNTKDDVLANINSLKAMGLNVDNIGFASPNSALTKDNAEEVLSLVSVGTLSYIRSGIQVRREGLAYSALTFLERKVHSPWLFRYLNKRNIIKNAKEPILMSVAIVNTTTVSQIISLIDKMADGEGVILMFHSILSKSDVGYGSDNWFFDIDKFEQLCKDIKDRVGVSVCTTAKLISEGRTVNV